MLNYTIDGLLNRQAEAMDPAGIHVYSETLVQAVVPDVAGKAYIDALADRLAVAEQMAREGKGHLVPETSVVLTFNNLMKHIGAPKSFYADDAAMRAFRSHSIDMPVLPALLSATRNGTNCNPGEAVYLFFLLLSENGKISGEHLDSIKMMTGDDVHREGSFDSGVTRSMYDEAEGRLTIYSVQHRRKATLKLFDDVSKTFGF